MAAVVMEYVEFASLEEWSKPIHTFWYSVTHCMQIVAADNAVALVHDFVPENRRNGNARFFRTAS